MKCSEYIDYGIRDHFGHDQVYFLVVGIFKNILSLKKYWA